jgi:hypothetical protein
MAVTERDIPGELLARCGPGAVRSGGTGEPAACDVLVLDGPRYTARQVALRLHAHGPLCRRFIAVGGLKTRAFRDGPARGVLPAVRGFLGRYHGDWRAAEWRDAGTGFLVLARGADGPAVDIGAAPSYVPEEFPARRQARRCGEGIGAELAALTASIGLSADSLPKLPEGCPWCKNLAAQMNIGGTPWIRANREAILAQLRAAYKALPRRAWAKAVTLAVLTGLAFRVRFWDPAPGLLRLARRRWVVKVRQRRAAAGKAGRD